MKSHLVRGPAVAAAVGSRLGAPSTLGWAGTLKDQICKIIMKDQHFHHRDHICDQQDPTGRQIQQLYLDQHQGS